MTESQLKQKWSRHARKHGLRVRAISPTGVAGIPDLQVRDTVCEQVVRDFKRGRLHEVEAKVARRGANTFLARRDATPAQVRWMLTTHALGGSAWWLVLSPDRWLLVPADRLQVTRRAFAHSSVEYGKKPAQLMEPDRPRTRLVYDANVRLRAVEDQVARLYASD